MKHRFDALFFVVDYRVTVCIDLPKKKKNSSVYTAIFMHKQTEWQINHLHHVRDFFMFVWMFTFLLPWLITTVNFITETKNNNNNKNATVLDVMSSFFIRLYGYFMCVIVFMIYTLTNTQTHALMWVNRFCRLNRLRQGKTSNDTDTNTFPLAIWLVYPNSVLACVSSNNNNNNYNNNRHNHSSNEDNVVRYSSALSITIIFRYRYRF